MGGLGRAIASLATVVLAGCGAGERDDTPSPAEAAAIQWTDEQDDGTVVVTPNGAFLDRNPVYRKFAASILSTSPIDGQASVGAARLRSQALDQTRYPQFQPSLSVDENADPVGRIGVSQIVFTNGKFRAEKDVLRAGEIEAVANYLVSANQRVADGLLAYLDIDYFRRLAVTAERLEKKYSELVNQAEQRVAGGVSDGTEVTTFKLKLLEAQADKQINRANQQLAEARVRDLTAGVAMPSTPPSLQNVAPNSEAPEIVVLLARMAAAEGQISLERAKRRPSVSLEAFSETNLESGETDDGISLGVGVSVPLGVKNDLEIRAAEAERTALEADLTTTRKDVERRISQLQASVSRDAKRLATLRELVGAAEARLDNFEEQFLSGTVSIEEAVSVLETYRRSMDQMTEARNEMLKAQVEIARTNGQLLPALN